jgi:FixJ family two-component response regulator
MLDGFVETQVRWSEVRGEGLERVYERAARRSPSANAPCDRARFSRHAIGDPVVYVLDEDPRICQAVRVAAERAGWHFEAFASAGEFLDSPRHPAPCCLVLDTNVRDVDGIELQRLLAAERPAMPIIVVAAEANVPRIVQSMKAGALEFLLKPPCDDELHEGISRAIDRSRDARREEVDRFALRACHDSLTRREREVMVLVVSGRLNKQVADELGISEITVKAHRGSVMRKMRARSFASLVNMAAKLGFAAT